MKKIIDYDNLYVAYPVYDHMVETEMYEQYETMGNIRHHIIVTPKKVLIYSKVDQDGNVKYYRYGTDEEVHESSYECSYDSASSPLLSLYSGYINGWFVLPIKSMREGYNEMYSKKKKEVGYFIPFSQYMEEHYGVSMSSISPAMADKVLKLLNIGSGKSFELSPVPKRAKEQLEKLGYHTSTQTKKKVDL